MYEHITYEGIMARMLDRVRSEFPQVDTREGSLVYTAVAPAALELAIMYTELDRVLDETFAETASLEYLEKRAKERGISQRAASPAVMKAEFDVDVPIGTRFNLNEYNYVVTGTNQLTCETPGSAPNSVFGTLTPIDPITGLNSASITECIIPGEDEEDVEALRTRYFDSLGMQSYGFNAKQYREVVNDMDGVGATKVTPAANGAGTVGIVILDSEYKAPSSTLVETVQTALDPVTNSGEGLGLAPIGHRVTVNGAVNSPINITCAFEYVPTYTWDAIKEDAYTALDEYFTELATTWEDNSIVVRINQINSVLMGVSGVLDVSGTQLNGSTSNIALEANEIPVRGTVNGNS